MKHIICILCFFLLGLINVQAQSDSISDFKWTVGLNAGVGVFKSVTLPPRSSVITSSMSNKHKITLEKYLGLNFSRQLWNKNNVIRIAFYANFYEDNYSTEGKLPVYNRNFDTTKPYGAILGYNSGSTHSVSKILESGFRVSYYKTILQKNQISLKAILGFSYYTNWAYKASMAEKGQDYAQPQPHFYDINTVYKPLGNYPIVFLKPLLTRRSLYAGIAPFYKINRIKLSLELLFESKEKCDLMENLGGLDYDKTIVSSYMQLSIYYSF